MLGRCLFADLIDMYLLTRQTFLADFNRFRIEDVPPRSADRQQLIRLANELTVSGARPAYVYV